MPGRRREGEGSAGQGETCGSRIRRKARRFLRAPRPLLPLAGLARGLVPGPST